jgi:Tfp pilus assembly protein PilF
VKGFNDENKKFKIRDKKSKPSKEQIINLAINLHLKGNISEATKYYQYCINQKFDDSRVFSNYAGILQSFGKLKEAEVSLRKAIKLNPEDSKTYYNLGNILFDLGKLKEAELSFLRAIKLNADYTKAHYNLGRVFCDLGKLKEAELSYLRAIKLNPDFALVYYALSLLKCSDKNTSWQNQLFSKTILKNKSPKEKIDIYFARGNILHKDKKYEESSRNFQLANTLKLKLNPSNADFYIKKSNALLIEADRISTTQTLNENCYENIFIVGMFRSGSTLLESILSLRNDVFDLGESNILEEAFSEYKKSLKVKKLSELYFKKISDKTELKITTNKWLNNYQYTGVIAKQIPNSKIIHCYRNPLDNILSIYRGHFSGSHNYASSLVDCAKVYLDQEDLMIEFKNRFRSFIYDLNYDSLVSNPYKEIKNLISWLGWKWEDKYLAPHLNPRSVKTASNIQVRSAINSKSIEGWKNYKKMLKPAMKIITKKNKYAQLKY